MYQSDNDRTCQVCRAEIPKGQLHQRHKLTGSRICKSCESKNVLHSPKDFVRES